MISTRLQGRVRASSWGEITFSQPSRTAPPEPGRQKTKVPFATPAQARDWIVDRPTDWKLTCVEHHREPLDDLVEQRRHRFGRDVAAGEAGAAGRDDGVDLRIVDPGLDGGADPRFVVRHDRARGEHMARAFDRAGEIGARAVRLQRARVRHGQHRDADGDEGLAHGRSASQRRRSAWSLSRASSQCAPSLRCSRFQKGASVFSRSIT